MKITSSVEPADREVIFLKLSPKALKGWTGHYSVLVLSVKAIGRTGRTKPM